MKRSALVLALALLGCSSGAGETSATRPSTAAEATHEEPAHETPSTPAASTRMTAPACAYGGSAPAVTVFVDVDTTNDLHDVTLSFAIADATTHAIAGRSREPMRTVVSPRERGLLDFSTQGTMPFDGELAAGSSTRLQYWAGVDDLPASVGGSIEVQATLSASDGTQLTATCTTAEMLPSS